MQYIRPCGKCGAPSHFDGNARVWPMAGIGRPVEHADKSAGNLYDETRRCVSAGAFTAAVMACRKVIMNVAVAQGAPEDQKFAAYVDWLFENAWIPPNGKPWVKYIKDRGNEANHEIHAMAWEDANALVTLTELLLRHMFEIPKIVPALPQPK